MEILGDRNAFVKVERDTLRLPFETYLGRPVICKRKFATALVAEREVGSLNYDEFSAVGLDDADREPEVNGDFERLVTGDDVSVAIDDNRSSGSEAAKRLL